MTYDFDGFEWRNRIQVVSCGPLAYVRNLKCGSTAYYGYFHDVFQWPEINFMDIDWENQTVFGHIMDPFVRRCKGMAEYLAMRGLIKLYHDNSAFRNMIRELPCIDQHSMSYYDTFGKQQSKLIHWIPMVGGFDATHARTEQFLRFYGITRSRIDLDRRFNRHEGSIEKKALSDDLYQFWESHHQELDIVKWYLQKDFRLWNKVLKTHGL